MSPCFSPFLLISLESLLPNPEPKAVGRAGDLSPFQERLDLENLPTQHSASTALWPPCLKGKEYGHPPGHKPLSTPRARGSSSYH